MIRMVMRVKFRFSVFKLSHDNIILWWILWSQSFLKADLMKTSSFREDFSKLQRDGWLWRPLSTPRRPLWRAAAPLTRALLRNTGGVPALKINRDQVLRTAAPRWLLHLPADIRAAVHSALSQGSASFLEGNLKTLKQGRGSGGATSAASSSAHPLKSKGIIGNAQRCINRGWSSPT